MPPVPTPGLLLTLRRVGSGEPARSVALFGHFGKGLIDRPYRLRDAECGRRGCFHRSCCQPFCEGETTNHQRETHRITVLLDRRVDPFGPSPRFITLRSLAPARRPKRDSPLARSSWPLRHLRLPLRAGYIPQEWLLLSSRRPFQTGTDLPG